MQLAIFDVDGTLTQTRRVDAECFVRAFAEELGITLSDNWADYASPTDSGITQQVYEERFGRRPADEELARLQRRFLALLSEAFARSSESCSAVDGAAAALKRLAQPADWRIAIATGGWRASALLKLRTARLDVTDVPAAFADDDVSRDAIVRTAVARAAAHHGNATFDRIVYIGDGIWDVHTAARLQLPFLGVGNQRRAARLRQAGAGRVIEDFVDFERFLEALQAAAIPGGPPPDSALHP